MLNGYLVVGLTAAVIVALGLARFMGRRRDEQVTFADAREERLTKQLAATLGCTLAQALPSVREELRLSPSQTDETLLKRAAYHYSRNQPEPTANVWRDCAPR